MLRGSTSGAADPQAEPKVADRISSSPGGVAGAESVNGGSERALYMARTKNERLERSIQQLK